MTGPLCPTSIYRSPVSLLKLQMAPRFILLMSSGSKEEESRYACLSEATASHSHRMWAEVSFFAPHLLHSGLSDSPGLCPVKGQKTSLGTQKRSRNQFLNPSWGVSKNSLPYPMLVNRQTSNPSSCILPRDSQGRLRFDRLQSRAVPCELVGNLITSYSSTVQGPSTAPPHDRQRYHSVPFGTVGPMESFRGLDTKGASQS